MFEPCVGSVEKDCRSAERASLERHFIFLLKCSCHRQSGVGSAHFHSLYLLFVSKQGIFWL